MLLEMNSGLDNDRRSLMEHISLLFTQYHELLTHSLQDKEHYHMEEKMFTLVQRLVIFFRFGIGTSTFYASVAEMCSC